MFFNFGALSNLNHEHSVLLSLLKPDDTFNEIILNNMNNYSIYEVLFEKTVNESSQAQFPWVSV